MLWSDPCKSDLIRSVLATVASCPAESIKVHHHHIFDANGCRGNPELVQRIPTARSKPVKSRFSVARSDIPKTGGGGGGGGGGCLSSSASNSWLRPTPCNLVAKPEIFISGIIRGQARPFIGPGFVQGALKLLEPSPWWRCLPRQKAEMARLTLMMLMTMLLPLSGILESLVCKELSNDDLLLNLLWSKMMMMTNDK